MDQLALIRKPIEKDLEQYLSLYEKDFTHENPLLHFALQHIRKRQGKRMRPILTLLSARCFGDASNEVLHASVSMELLHTASLVHDDIVDESDMRRGQASVNKLMSAQAAVLVGDYLLARSLQHSAKTRNVDVVNSIAKVSELLADGELLQLYTLDSDRVEESAYYDVIRCKTAVLFSTSAQIGALLAGADAQQQEAMRLYGEYIGIAFQIRDDMLDYSGGIDLGKPSGNDMKEGKLTLPAIFAINQQEEALSKGQIESNEPRMLDLALKVRRCEASAQEISTLVNFTLNQGGLQYAKSCMEHYADLALQQLSLLPQSEYTDSLRQFVNLVVSRDN